MERQELIDKIQNAKIVISKYDKKWRYPKTGDDQESCAMLKFMFDIEYKSGTAIFIPDDENQFGKIGNTNRNEEEG